MVGGRRRFREDRYLVSIGLSVVLELVVIIVFVVMYVVRVVTVVALVVVTAGEDGNEGCAQVLRLVSFPFVDVVGWVGTGWPA
jgi:hypothetical protein